MSKETKICKFCGNTMMIWGKYSKEYYCTCGNIVTVSENGVTSTKELQLEKETGVLNQKMKAINGQVKKAMELIGCPYERNLDAVFKILSKVYRETIPEVEGTRTSRTNRDDGETGGSSPLPSISKGGRKNDTRN